MAKGKGGESVGNLYLRLGLNYDELNQDFVAVEETLSSNIQRLNRQNKLIDIKAKIDFIGVTDAEQKIKIQQEALTRQIELQTQKVKLYESAWIAAGKANGLASKQAENAAIALKQQQLELANLSQRLKEVAEQQKQINQTKIDKANFDNSLLGRYTNIKGDVSGIIGNITNAFTGLKDATSSADAAITKSLEIIGSIPSTAGKVVAALASIPLVVKGIENSLLDLAKPAIAAGDAMYVMSRGAQLSIKDASKLNMIAKVTGIEISEVNSSMRRLSAQLNKADDEDNARMQMLKRFGANVKDSYGNIKNEIELIDELSKALLNAEAAGQGAAFRDIIGGKFWSADFITFLEDWAGNVELAGKIVRNGLADPKLAHDMQGNLNALNAQAGQLESAFSSAFMPMAEELIPRATERLGELTQVIADNAEGIKEFGKTAADVLNTVGDVAGAATKTVINTVGTLSEYHVTDALLDPTGLYREIALLKDVKEQRTAAFANQYAGDEEIQSAKDLQAKMPRYTAEYYEEVFEKIKEIRKKTEEETKKIQELADESLDIRLFKEGLISDDTLENIRKTTKATQDLSNELYKLTHNDYENKKFDVLNWQQNLLNAESTTAEQRELIAKITSAKLEQIERERADKLDEIRESVASLDRTALENRIADIEKEKQAWIQKGIDEVRATKAAEEQKAAAIKQLHTEWVEHVNSIHQNALEQRLAQIEKEKQAWIQKGIAEVEATKAAEEQKVQAQRNAAMDVLKNQLKDYRAFQEGGYEGLRDRNLRQLYKSGIRPEDLQITPQQLENFQKAQQIALNSLLPNFMTPTDQYNHNLLTQAQAQQQQQIQAEIDEMLRQKLIAALGGTDAGLNLDGFLKNILEGIHVYGFDENIKNSSVDLTEALQNVKTGFEDFDVNVGDVASGLTDLAQPIADVSDNLLNFGDTLQNISGLEDNISNIPQSFSDISQQIDGTAQSFSEIHQTLADITENFSALQQKIADIQISDKNQKQPVNVNVTVQISEAHAWDYSHIQELADKVADQIEPEIVRAVGGDSNSY